MPKQSDKPDQVYNYGCLMLLLNPNQIPGYAALLAAFKPADLYESDKPGEFGIEFEPHVTVLYGFHDEMMATLPRRIMNEAFLPDDKVALRLTGISNFHNPQYDVVKFDVQSPQLEKLNAAYAKKYPNTNEYDYHPHLTLAYVKSGKGPEYCKKLWELFGSKAVGLAGMKLAYSRPNGEKIVNPI